MESPDISVVVLAYRSASTIEGFVASLVTSLDEEKIDWEIILVGNYFEGTGDQTAEVVQRISDRNPRIKPVVHVKEGMMGWDMKSGLRAATGKKMAVIDGDGQMPCTDVIRVYNLMVEKGYDLVKTVRIKRSDGLYRMSISTVYNLLFKVMFPGINAWDINSKPKIMTRELYQKMNLESNGWFIDAEIMIIARRLKMEIGEIETTFHSIDSRPSFVKPLAILEFLANLIWYRIKEFGAK
ncbi:MAG: glycosyltransferase family 2 protein [Nitrospina sp.]|jgi:glycosyltransferase involved in cell wall biosynthesis|nr:glycosyltransferase family 2 protein [Nitrospina sp.]MBT3414292.1 glycosyltransferase family 2 protein [Nitrospina sp.]MBT3855479.1 glycosyltransferase family 2 protein [Nitrospina sp.]MBT4103682.1 glycosyltransferase family 2 protein [Nitrospina sp.]MBT4388405.1 glycosyltransferase family 2 protein [Nitrospina sp.]